MTGASGIAHGTGACAIVDRVEMLKFGHATSIFAIFAELERRSANGYILQELEKRCQPSMRRQRSMKIGQPFPVCGEYRDFEFGNGRLQRLCYNPMILWEKSGDCAHRIRSMHPISSCASPNLLDL
ncbi:hypothetical protein FRC15_007573 [Serendipita sp. 397]|nr:hypothetical protein FRC15_007573 [Serendipita sp. 397]